MKTSDGVSVGGSTTLILKGDNPVVDRRAIAFNAKDPGVKKVEAHDAGVKKDEDNDARREQQHGRGHADRHRRAVRPEGGLREDLRGGDQDAPGRLRLRRPRHDVRWALSSGSRRSRPWPRSRGSAVVARRGGGTTLSSQR